MKFGDQFSELPDPDDSFFEDHWEVVVVRGVAYTLRVIHDPRGWWCSNLLREHQPGLLADVEGLDGPT